MGRLREKRITVISWDAVLAFLLGFICLGGATFFADNLRWPFMVLTVAGTAVFKGKLYLTGYSALWFITAAALVISVPFSYDKAMTLSLAGAYLLAVFLLCFPHTDYFREKLLRAMGVFSLIVAVSIIASTMIENFVLDYLWVLVNPLRTPSVVARIQNELSRGNHSGLAGEQAQAALIVNVGIAAKLASFFSGRKIRKKDFLELTLYLIALILTGKRMLFVIPAVAGTAALLLSDRKHKTAMVCVTLLGLAAVLGIAYCFIPQMSIMYRRLIGDVGSRYYDPLSGRGELWQISIQMFLERPLLGYGFGSYNAYAYDAGFLRNGQRWNYFGHNCYLQLLGEMGLAGAVWFVGMFGYALAVTVRNFRNFRRRLPAQRKYYLMFSLYLQLMLLVYSFSGNVLYHKEQVFLWFLGIAMSFSVAGQGPERSRS